MVWTERTNLAYELWAYGEDTLWKRPLTARDATMRQVGELAAKRLYGSPEASMLIAHALASAAVEVFEGVARPLARQRRRPAKDFPGYPRVRHFFAREWLDRDATRARRAVG